MFRYVFFFKCVLWLDLCFLMTRFSISGQLGPGRVRVSESSLKKHFEKKQTYVLFNENLMFFSDNMTFLKKSVFFFAFLWSRTFSRFFLIVFFELFLKWIFYVFFENLMFFFNFFWVFLHNSYEFLCFLKEKLTIFGICKVRTIIKISKKLCFFWKIWFFKWTFYVLHFEW